MPNNDTSETGTPRNGAVSFRGGFSTSVYDGLFEDHGHSDCCVITCCGLLLYDRNVYLMTDQRPSWKRRCGILFCLLLLVLATLAALGAASYLYAYEVEHLKELEAEGKTPTKEDVTRMDQVKKLMDLATICRLLVSALAIYLLFKAGQYRFRARRFLMARMYQESTEEDNEIEVNHATAETPLVVAPTTSEAMTKFLQAQKYNTCCATTPLGCIPKDAIVDPSNPTALDADSNKATDFCHCLWKLLSGLCCGTCCSCWCQCLGLCALAQEDRELQRMLPKVKFEMDYITFQPFADYFPKLQALRQNKINNMLTHFAELSQLARHLLRSMIIVFSLLALLAFSGYDPLFQPAHLVVVCMTLLQAFLIVYFVHWQWNRFDLSVDAVIKYFASGFILCTANAFVYETFVQTSLTFTATFIRILLDPSAVGDDDEVFKIGKDDDAIDETDGTKSSPLWLLVIMAFLNAFAVAALVEEVSKYFGYWMVEHPDLALPAETERDASPVAAAEGQEGNNTRQDSTAASPQRTLGSLGAGITIAMVTTAVGFACCENFVYVFVYSRTANAANELVTLVARSIFPVHPLAAAIQSIGVCQRDVERDSTIKLGRILLPALLLHGCFDFALMFLSSWNASSGEGGAKLQDSLDDPSMQKGASLSQALPALISSVSIVLIGIIYYVVKALAQRKRLDELDKRQQGSGEYERLL